MFYVLVEFRLLMFLLWFLQFLANCLVHIGTHFLSFHGKLNNPRKQACFSSCNNKEFIRQQQRTIFDPNIVLYWNLFSFSFQLFVAEIFYISISLRRRVREFFQNLMLVSLFRNFYWDISSSFCIVMFCSGRRNNTSCRGCICVIHQSPYITES